MRDNSEEDKILSLEEAIRKSSPRIEYHMEQVTARVDMDEFLETYTQLLNDPSKVRPYIELLSPEVKQKFENYGLKDFTRNIARKAGRIKEHTSKKDKMIEGDEWLKITLDGPNAGETIFERGKPTKRDIDKAWIMCLFGLNSPSLDWDIKDRFGKEREQKARKALAYIYNEVLPTFYERVEITERLPSGTYLAPFFDIGGVTTDIFYKLKDVPSNRKNPLILSIGVPLLFASERPFPISWNLELPTHKNKEDKNFFEVIRKTIDLVKQCPELERLSIYQREPSCLIPTYGFERSL